MDKLVSVILPVYGVEKYLPECVDSLLRQSYRNLEIILVDDASPDSCGTICDSYATKDSRVRVIHKQNGGAASARNAGLDAARGEFICFVDSDDIVEPEYVACLLETLGKGDMAMCGFSLWSRSGRKEDAPTPGRYDRILFMKQFLEDWRCSLLWNKLYRRSAIGSLRMAEGHRVDDEFFTYRVALNCRQVTVTEKCLYHYRLRRSSVMQDDGAAKERMMLDRIAYVTERYDTVAAALPQLKNAYFADAADTLSRYWLHSLGMPQAQKQIRQWAQVHLGQLLSLGKQGFVLARCFFLKKPAVGGESNPLQTAEEAYFD